MLGDVAVAVNPEDERYRQSGRQARAAAAHRPHDPGDRRRLRRPGVRHRLREDHAGARFQRLPGRAAPRPGADQHPHAGCEDQRQRAGGLPRPRPLRGAQARARRSAGAGAAGVGEAAQAQGAALRAHRRDRRADAHRPVVRAHGRARQARPGSGRPRRGQVLPRALDHHLQPLAREHPGLVHLAPALVGTPDPGLVRRGGQRLRRPQRGGSPRQARLAPHASRRTAARQRRARHLVLLGAGAVHLARLARARRATWTCSCPPRCWSPASTSSSSGSPG